MIAIRLVPFLLALIVLAAGASGCASRTFRERERVAEWSTAVELAARARTPAEARRPLAESFVRYESADDATGLSGAAFTDVLEWDLALRRAVTYSGHRFDETTLSARYHEENDLTRLVEFPGWDGTMSWTFDEQGRIAEERRRARDDRDLRNWLAPAIAWLRERHPADIDWLLPEGRLRRTGETARRWVELLPEWRAATDRREIPLGGDVDDGGGASDAG